MTVGSLYMGEHTRHLGIGSLVDYNKEIPLVATTAAVCITLIHYLSLFIIIISIV